MALKVIKQIGTGNFFIDIYRIRNGKPGNTGTVYRIAGLYARLSSNGFRKVEIPKLILEDLGCYRRYCEERKKIWTGKGSRESKLEKTEVLRNELIDSRISRGLSERL